LELVAKEFSEQEVPITVGHVECSSAKSFWQSRYGFDGFPHLHLWHRRNDGQQNDGITINELVGSTVRVTANEHLLLEAARKADMSKKRDADRLQALGSEGEVLEVEVADLTAQLKVTKSGAIVWFPLEVLSATEGGKPLPPIQRPTSVAYRPTSWKREAMRDFAVRMMRPTVTVLKDLSKLEAKLKNESMAALVLCAPEVTPRFLAFVRPWQDKHRAFHAPDPDACPVEGAEAGPQLVVYSPPRQQWAAKGKPSAAAIVAGTEVLDDEKLDLAAWFDRHRFPGMLNVSYENFPEVVNAERHIAVVAVDMSSPKQKKVVQQKIREAAAPKKSKRLGTEVYTYGSNSTYWGVMDGMLNGLDAFGIRKGQLPRVVIFEKGGRWVEDEEHLTVQNLARDMAKSGELWRMQGGPYGYLLSFLRMTWRSFVFYDQWADDIGGLPGRILLCVMWAILPVLMGRNIIQTLMAGDEPEEKSKDD